MFFVAYLAKPASPRRPITFLFNGGPGAASAYLHLGTAGPRRLAFSPEGRVLPGAVELVDNHESWLEFSDLVFVDPIGTGFSRTVDESRNEQDPFREEDKDRKTDLGAQRQSFFKLQRDLEVLAECLAGCLNRFSAWERPVHIAGESYGGFRVAKLVRLLLEKGIPLHGAMLISPALELNGLSYNDYEALPWIGSMPTYALAAHAHGRCRVSRSSTIEKLAAAAESFARDEYARLLVWGDALPSAERDKTLARLADFIGLAPEYVSQREGRIPIWVYARELLRDRRQVVGFYDASYPAIDPFPDRDYHAAPDPTLVGIGPSYAAGINAHLRHELRVKTDREYHLLNEEAFLKWQHDRSNNIFEHQLGSVDDLRFGFAANPSLRVFITHGWYDLVTPYYASLRLTHLMRLTPAQKKNLRCSMYRGGHMYYMWQESRKTFTEELKEFVYAERR